MSEASCRQIVRERSGGICELAIPDVCLGAAANMHHRRKEGRVWKPSNVLDVCGSGTTGCHGYLEANPLWSNQEGYWLRAGDGEPDQVAVHMRWEGLRSWWCLDDDGVLTWDGGDFEPVAPRSTSWSWSVRSHSQSASSASSSLPLPSSRSSAWRPPHC